MGQMTWTGKSAEGWWVEVQTRTGRQRYLCGSEQQAESLAALLEQPPRPTPPRNIAIRPSGLVARVSRALRGAGGQG
jgi:hypothetical protein